MTTVREAFDAMGFRLTAAETVCIVTNINGTFVERSLHDVAGEDVGANRYFSTGTFGRHQRWGKGGRTLKNVQRILEFPFDFDLKDFLGVDKDDLYDLDDDEIGTYVTDLQAAVEEIFGRLMLPIHRLDYTGYGLSAHIAIPGHQPENVAELKNLHAGIVTKMNGLYGGILADAQVKDAGPRIMRLVPCLNVGTYAGGRIAPERQTRTIYRLDGVASELTLRAAANQPSWKRSQDIPIIGDSLPADRAEEIVNIYKPLNRKGQKHVLCLAIAAQLGKAGMSEEQTLSIVRAIAAEDEKPWDREKAVQDTYAKLRDGVVVSGYFALKNYVDEDAIGKVDAILEPIRKKQGPRLVLMGGKSGSGKDGVASTFAPHPIPDACFYGWHRAWRDLVAPTTGAADAFHLAASMTMQAATMGRRVSAIYSGGPVMPNLFSITVGRTGFSFKDTAYNRTMEMRKHGHQMLRDQGQNVLMNDFSELRDLASREALVRSHAAHSNRYLFASEFTPILKNANRESTSTLLDGLIYVWDCPDAIENNSIAAKKDMGNVALNPTLNIYGGIQPDRMSVEMTDNVMTSGLGNRLSIFMGTAKHRHPNTPSLDVVAAGELYIDLWAAITSYSTGSRVVMNDQSEKVWAEWFDAQNWDSEDELANDMKTRHPVMVQKWALMFAVTDQSRFIEPRHLEPALAVCDWMWANIQLYLPSWGVSTDRKIEERILAVLQKNQPMLKRDLNRYVRGRWSAREFAQVFRAMKENGQIVMDSTEKYVVLPEFAESQMGVA